MTNWREVPFVRLTLPFVLGILLAISVPVPISFAHWGILFLFFFLLFLSRPNPYFHQRWMFGSVLYLFLFFVGYQLTYQHHAFFQEQHFKKNLQNKNTVIGIITSKKNSGERFRLQLKVQQINDSLEQFQQVIGNILVYLDHDTNSVDLVYGDQLMIQARLAPIRSVVNPHAFNFKKYWHHQNLHYQAFVQTNHWQRLKKQQGNFVMSCALKTRAYFLRILRKYLPTDNEYAVASALILGDKQSLDGSLKNAYAGTGAMHVLAVSGLHVGLVYLGLAFLLGFIKIKKRYWIWLRTWLLILGVWLFALLTGAAPSVLRAATMFSFIIVGKAMRHHPSIYNTLAASAFCLLCFNPFLLMEVGFQLSYLAVTGIIYFQPKIYRWWIIDNVVGDYLWKLTSVSIAAQLTTLPISLFYFHQFPLYFWLSGLIVIPAAMVILSSGIILLLFETLLPFLAVVPATILYWATWIMNSLIFLIRELPIALISGIWISGLVAVLMYSFLGLLIITINTKKVKWLLSLVGIAVGISAILSFTHIGQQHNRKITIYSVYKNTLIDFMDGKKGIILKNINLSTAKENFTAQNNRWANGLTDIKKHTFSSPSIKADNFWYQDGFVQFFDKRMIILQQQKIWKENTKIKLDIVVLSNNSNWTINDVIKNFDCQIVVFDASNNRSKTHEWIEECKQLNLDYYDIITSGAWTLPLLN